MKRRKIDCKILESRVLIRRNELATVMGLSTRTLRRYELRGLLTPIPLSPTLVAYRTEKVRRLLDYFENHSDQSGT